MSGRIKLAIKILLGNDIIIYKENTKEIVAMIGGKENINILKIMFGNIRRYKNE